MVEIKKIKIMWRKMGKKEYPCTYHIWLGKYVKDKNIEHIYAMFSYRNPLPLLTTILELKNLVIELNNAYLENNDEKLRDTIRRLNNKINRLVKLLEELDIPEECKKPPCQNSTQRQSQPQYC